MQPLLKIQSIPIKIEAQTKRAALQQSAEPVPVQQRKPAPQQTPAPQQAPAPQQRVGQKAQDAPRANANRGTRQAEYSEPASTYFQDAAKAVQSYNQSGVVGDVPASDFTPVTSAQVEYQAPAIPQQTAQSTASSSFKYQMDRNTFDWNATSKPQLEYVPASIEYSITQYPEVVIEYVGEPIYVPASANPNYVPPPELKNT